MKWKLTQLSGIDVYIHWSFWLLPAWVLFSATGGPAAAIASVLLIFAIFGCVVLHEMGHALAARYYGIGTHDITLYPIGGVARLEQVPERPVQELVIALAGPAVNVVIAGSLLLGFGLGPLATASVAGPAGAGFVGSLIAVNIVLVLFNMLPAFPMDGGRVLRSLLAMFMSYSSATEIAGRVGQGMAILLGIAGLFASMPNLALIAVFVFLAASAELARARWQEAAPIMAEPVHSQNPFDDEGIVWVTEVQPRPFARRRVYFMR